MRKQPGLKTSIAYVVIFAGLLGYISWAKALNNRGESAKLRQQHIAMIMKNNNNNTAIPTIRWY